MVIYFFSVLIVAQLRFQELLYYKLRNKTALLFSSLASWSFPQYSVSGIFLSKSWKFKIYNPCFFNCSVSLLYFVDNLKFSFMLIHICFIHTSLFFIFFCSLITHDFPSLNILYTLKVYVKLFPENQFQLKHIRVLIIRLLAAHLIDRFFLLLFSRSFGGKVCFPLLWALFP